MTKSYFERLGVELRTLPAAKFRPVYPHGNKILAAAAELPTRYAMFFDSDTLLARPVNYQWLCDYELAVAPAFRRNFSIATDAPFRAPYETVGLKGPTAMVRLTNGQLCPAYYNAGFIFFDRATQFGERWLETAYAIDADERVPNKRPWLDQIALPVVEHLLQLNTLVLPPEYNTELVKESRLRSKVILGHYTGGIDATPGLRALADALLASQGDASITVESLQTQLGYRDETQGCTRKA